MIDISLSAVSVYCCASQEMRLWLCSFVRLRIELADPIEASD